MRKRKTYVSYHLRLMGRLLVILRRLEPSKVRMIDFVNPECFDLFVKASNILSGGNGTSYLHPSTAIDCGHELTRMIEVKYCRSLEEQNQDMVESMERMEKLKQRKWGESVSSAALETLDERRFNTVTALPLTEDLMKLNKYLRDQLAVETDYWELQKLAAARLLTFNKRRPTELEEMK